MFLASAEECSSARETIQMRKALAEVSNREPHNPQESSAKGRQLGSGGMVWQEKENRGNFLWYLLRTKRDL